MNLSETAHALALVQAFDQRTVGDADVVAWQSLLPDATLADTEEAIRRHYAERTERIMPAHVRHLVRDIHGEREAIARATGWAPGQAGVPRDQVMPVAPTGGRLALSDLPAAVAELVARVRAELPESSREVLYPREAAWKREHAAYLRQQNAQPNPDYRPRTSDTGILPHAYRCADCTFTTASLDRILEHENANEHRREGTGSE